MNLGISSLRGVPPADWRARAHAAFSCPRRRGDISESLQTEDFSGNPVIFSEPFFAPSYIYIRAHTSRSDAAATCLLARERAKIGLTDLRSRSICGAVRARAHSSGRCNDAVKTRENVLYGNSWILYKVRSVFALSRASSIRQDVCRARAELTMRRVDVCCASTPLMSECDFRLADACVRAPSRSVRFICLR